MDWPDLTYSLNPTWPDWLPDAAALPTLLGVAAVLVLLTLWTYLGSRGASRGASLGRVLVVLLLRLAALAVALVVALRPAVGVQVLEGLEPSKLLVVVDASESMNIPDEFNSLSRWETARRILAARPVADALKRLSADEQIEAVYYQAAEHIAPFDPQGAARGKRTDIGTWLHELHQKHAGQDRLRGVILLSDGADNGTRYPTLDEARRWSGVCPIYTLGHGKPQGDGERRDVIVAGVRAAPSPVPAKAKLTVTGTVHAPGFKDVLVDVSLWIQGSHDKEPRLLAEMRGHPLPGEKNNEVVFTQDAPETPDEYKLTLKIAKVAGEADDTNNEATTYVQVTREGISVLWVEAHPRAYESVFPVRYALSRDKRIRVYRVQPDPRTIGTARDFYEFDRRHYDVIVLGDLTAQQFDGGNGAILEKVRDLVRDKETHVGLMMLGGLDALGKGGWGKTPLAEILPVALDTERQLDQPVRVRPTEAALKLGYPFLNLEGDAKKNRELWDKTFRPLDGMALLGTVRPGATVLAGGTGDEPILVAGQPAGRVLVFGGDTTWKAWLRPGTQAAYNQFWRHAVLWLANQDDRAGTLWVELKSRRLLAGSPDRLDYAFGLKDKDGKEARDATFDVKVFGPAGEAVSVPPASPEKDHRRGTLAAPATPGEYRLQIAGKGKDARGEPVADSRTVHFQVVAEDLEMQRRAPDHELLTDIAKASGGKFDHAGEAELLGLLGELKGQVRRESHARVERWPDWDRHPATDAWPDQIAGLWASSALLWMLAFAALLCGEWGLRRKWGMV